MRSRAHPLGSSTLRRTVHGRDPFSTWIGGLEKEKTCSYSTRTRRVIYDVARIPRASRPLLIPINRPLNIEERHTAT
jgi:hypothetical protein